MVDDPPDAMQHGQRVLIVDQHAVSRIAMVHAFTQRGHVATAAGTAEDALGCIETFEPSVVILDWAFRDGTGIKLSSRLRARSMALGRALVVVAVSVVDEPAGFRLDEDVDDYLIKPAPADAIENAFLPHLPPTRAGVAPRNLG